MFALVMSAAATVLRSHLTAEALIFDGVKGHRFIFRLWENWIRLPIPVGTHNRMLAHAPIEGFLRKNANLSTLGFDPEPR